MKILLADDDRAVRRVIQFKLEKKGFEVVAVSDGQEALDNLRAQPFDLVLADIRMPRLDGIELLEKGRAARPDLKIILITAHSTVSQAVQAVKLGAFDYLTKPFEDEELFVAIDKALAFHNLEQENRQLKSRLREARSWGVPTGVSPAFRALMEMVDKIAPTDATVLLTGESGTGKELMARTIHQKSRRADKEFITVDCASIPRDLLESELFGHVKGAFTGAVRDKKGRFELADEGTILLDEIGEMPIELQAKLLRVIQERVVEPVGSEQKRDVDIRIIAATNCNLREKVADNSFREDLFYRLNVIPIQVPPLRERREDILPLIEVFIRRYGGRAVLALSSDLKERLLIHKWPGNIRELENLVERMVVLRRADTLTVADLPADFGGESSTERVSMSSEPKGHLTFHEAERKLILDALVSCGWNRTRAAEFLRIPRHLLVYRMKKYNISGP